MFIVDRSKKIHEQITENRWCQGPMYADAEGESSDPSHEDCQSACLYGWMESVYMDWHSANNSEYLKADKRAMKLSTEKGWGGYIMFNDSPSTTFEDVLEFCREADI